MSTLEVNKITPVSGGTTVQVGESGDTINIPAGATIANAGTSTGFGISYAEAQRPNAIPLIINGNMAVNQRGTSTGITTPGYYACDRFQTAIGNLATWTISQDSDVPSGYGFANSLKLDCTTADASPSTGEVVIVRQKFEGQDVQLLKKGTSSAEKVTVAFWIKATKTGTNILELFDRDNSRTISQSYTISSSNTWEYKVINFSGDTTGVLDDDNNLSFEIAWWLASGTDYTSGTLQTSWGSQTDANRAVGQVNHGDSTSNNVYITGVQLEVGEYTSATLPPFQHESYGDNFLRCQRYCQQFNHDTTGGNETQVGIGWAYNSSSIYGFKDLVIPMRTQPTMSSPSGTNYYRTHNNNTAQSFNQIGFNSSNTKGFWIFNAGAFSGLATDQIRTVEIVNANGYVRADAEL